MLSGSDYERDLSSIVAPMRWCLRSSWASDCSSSPGAAEPRRRSSRFPRRRWRRLLNCARPYPDAWVLPAVRLEWPSESWSNAGAHRGVEDAEACRELFWRGRHVRRRIVAAGETVAERRPVASSPIERQADRPRRTSRDPAAQARLPPLQRALGRSSSAGDYFVSATTSRSVVRLAPWGGVPSKNLVGPVVEINRGN